MKKIVLLMFLLPSLSFASPIWSNKDKGGDDYLVGTIHLGDDRLNQLPPALRTAIDNVDTVVLEIDLGAISALEQQQTTMKYGLLPAGKSLKTELSKDVYTQAQQYLKSIGYDIAPFEQVKPWMLGLTMVQLTYIHQGLNLDKGVDQQIYQYAKAHGKKVVGLESFDQQLQFFDKILALDPSIDGDALVRDTLSELKNHQDLPQQMLDAWFKADMRAFDQIYQSTMGQSDFDSAAEQILLKQRNLDWQQQLTPMLKDEKILVAVGTLHYSGPYSLLKLLPGQFSAQ